MRNYNNLEVAMLKSTGTITTTSLDSFTRQNSVDEIDFIKIDVQGAELDVFKGATKALDNVVFIVSEVEFIPLYIDQPLFGDVCKYLTENFINSLKWLGVPLNPLLLIVILTSLASTCGRMPFLLERYLGYRILLQRSC